jgi:hypothetical protein
MKLLVCDSLVDGQCVNPSTIEITQEALNYLDSYTGFVEEYYWVGFESVIGLFIAGLAVGLILKQVRMLK